ncbi:EAL domain-containing protein [Hyphomicrobiales bacterium BP6-180914]|uniref:EAL domain-containing protein n=1 Tax=Lichenifustis flavocetrariae TaxID=2949735 RepID=A0AA42CS59_9HYPH|nr:EAL domain-containing protein [Lichenifustis flavocetrariae]
MVPPDIFIPLAEDLGLIGALTDRLMRQACREAASWPHAVTLACNLSPVQLCDPGLPGAIRDVLKETGLLPSRLELEITESALVGDLALARASLGQLKVLGVRLAIDDFGTGYSSLRHLHSLPFDKIKIDRGFVAGMAGDIDSGKIVSAVVGLGRSLAHLIHWPDDGKVADVAYRLEAA